MGKFYKMNYQEINVNGFQCNAWHLFELSTNYLQITHNQLRMIDNFN